MTASAGLAQDLIDFLKVDVQQVLDQIEQLDQIAATFNGVDIPLLQDALGGIADVARFISTNIIDPLTGASGTASFGSSRTWSAAWRVKSASIPRTGARLRLHHQRAHVGRRSLQNLRRERGPGSRLRSRQRHRAAWTSAPRRASPARSRSGSPLAWTSARSFRAPMRKSGSSSATRRLPDPGGHGRRRGRPRAPGFPRHRHRRRHRHREREPRILAQRPRLGRPYHHRRVHRGAGDPRHLRQHHTLRHGERHPAGGGAHRPGRLRRPERGHDHLHRARAVRAVDATTSTCRHFDDLFGDFGDFTAQDLLNLIGQLATHLHDCARARRYRRARPAGGWRRAGEALDVADFVSDALLFDDGDDGTDGATALVTDLNAALASAGLDGRIRARRAATASA